MPDPKDYIRMFAGKSFPYLFSNVFLGYYNSMNVVSVQGNDSWMCFFPKNLVEKTKKEGGELYTSETEYKQYKSEFNHYIDSSQKLFEKARLVLSVDSKRSQGCFPCKSRHSI